MPPGNVTKILILRFSSLGDIIMTTAAVRALRNRYPQARIDMIVRSDFLDLIRFNPHLTHTWGLDRHSGWKGLWQLRREINSVGYDLIYDAHRSLRTRALMPFLRAGAKAYFAKHYLRRALALTFKLPLLDARRFLVRFIDPLKRFGVVDDDQGPQMLVDPASEASALAKAGIVADGKPRIGLIPSAQWPGKRWPPERFTEVARLLLKHTSYELVIFGGKEDVFCQAIADALPADRVINTQGKLSILESAALVRHCRFVIANDTGLMHVADALGVPSVLIFGPTSAELGCLPHHPLTRLVEQKLWCRPCSKNGQAPCIRTRRWCLDRSTPQSVYEEARRLDQALLKQS
jgi:lipopolysaccharide heptosyltransferase II